MRALFGGQKLFAEGMPEILLYESNNKN